MVELVEWSSPIDPIQAQKSAVRLLEWACYESQGAPEGSARYETVTGGRDFGAGYSSCGDLAHWMLWRLGCRYPWVNVDVPEEKRRWRVGENVSLLAWNDYARQVNVQTSFEPGDIIIVWNDARNGFDAHVICVIEQRESVLLTAEYGQPGGALKERKLVPRPGGLVGVGVRLIQRRVPLLSVLTGAQKEGYLRPIAFPEP